MRMKLVVIVTLLLTMCACSSAPSAVSETTKISVTSELELSSETEKATEGEPVFISEDEKNMSDWDDFTGGGGAFEPITDGYGLGVEIEITPVP